MDSLSDSKDPLLAHILANPAAAASSPSIFNPPASSSSSGVYPVSPSESNKTLSQRRAISLSVSPADGKPISPGSSKSPTLSPVSAAYAVGLPKSPNLPQVEARNRLGTLNPLPPVSSSIKLIVKDAPMMTLTDSSGPEGPEDDDTDARELSSSFEAESPEYKPGNLLRKARSPLSTLSRVVEVQSKSISDKEIDVNTTNIHRVSGGIRSKSGWGSGSDDREIDGVEDFVYAEDERMATTAAPGAVEPLSANRRLSPLNNRAGRLGLLQSNNANQSSMTDVKADGEYVLQQSDPVPECIVADDDGKVSNNQEEDITSDVPQAILPALQDNADDYNDEEFEDIEEDISIEEQVRSVRERVHGSSILYPSISLTSPPRLFLSPVFRRHQY